MYKFVLKEDKPPIRLPVVFSPAINKEIESIDEYNQPLGDALDEWNDYLEGIRDYLSYAKIAFDYANRFRRLPNGCPFIEDFGYNVGYSVKTSKRTHRAYVYVFMINLRTEEFGLKIPPKVPMNISGERIATAATPFGYGADYVSENRNPHKLIISESRLRKIIAESIRKVLYN